MDVMREEGREEGRADATLKDIRNIMTKLNKSADEAMDRIYQMSQSRKEKP